MERRAFPGVEGTFIHPFDDDDFIAGNATMGLEIVEDLPDVDTVITAIGGGGLITGVASGLRARKPERARLRRGTGDRRAGRRVLCDRGGVDIRRIGKRRSSTARAARASFHECGSECGR